MPAGNKRTNCASPRRTHASGDQVHAAVISNQLEQMFERARHLQHELEVGELNHKDSREVNEEMAMLQERLKALQMLQDAETVSSVEKKEDESMLILSPAEEVREIMKTLPERTKRSKEDYTPKSQIPDGDAPPAYSETPTVITLSNRKPEAQDAQHLLLELRRELAPVLESWLSSQDHPLTATPALARALVTVLRRHITANKRPGDGRSSVVELGHTLATLQRTLASKLSNDATRLVGFESQLLKVQSMSAVASAEALERRLWDASFAHGSTMEITFGQQKLELNVDRTMTFAKLTTEAARYWAVEPDGWCIADQHGVQWLDTMLVHDGMRLCPPGTSLHLLKTRPVHIATEPKPTKDVHQIEADLRRKTDVDVESGIPLTEKRWNQLENAGGLLRKTGGLIKATTTQRVGEMAVAVGAKVEEHPNTEVSVVNKRTPCCVKAAPRTRTEMLLNFVQVIVLSVIIYLCIHLTNDTADSFAMCSSLRKGLAEPDFRPNHNFHKLRIPSDFLLWSRRIFATTLFENYEEAKPETYEYPAVAMRQNALLGGIRIRQLRGAVSSDTNCAPLPFVPDSELNRPKSTFTSMDPIGNIKRSLASIGFSYDSLPAEEQAALQAEALAAIESTLDCYKPLSEGMSTSDFGALVLPPGARIYEAARLVNVPDFECAPDPCSPPELEGLLKAFRYQNASDWGNPADFFGEQGSVAPVGFGLTLPQNIDARSLTYILKTLADTLWVDRATRKIMLEADFYNPQLGRVAAMRFVVGISPAGFVDPHVHCNTFKARSSITDGGGLSELVLQGVLAVWLIARLLRTLYSVKLAGGSFVVVGGTEFVLHILVSVLGLTGIALRVTGIVAMDEHYRIFEAAQLVPPFMPKLPWIPLWNHFSVLSLAASFLFCQLRLMLYYSLFSTRLFVLRRTISHAMAKLLPTILLLLVVLISFAAGGNVLFGANASQWRDMQTSIVYVVAMLRRPALMDLERMSEADPTKEIIGASVLAPLFYIAFTAVILWIMGSLVRSVIITAYAEMCDKYYDVKPDDLKESPWPSLSPVYYMKYVKATRQHKDHIVKMKKQRQLEHTTAMKIQRQKALEARELEKKLSSSASTRRAPGKKSRSRSPKRSSVGIKRRSKSPTGVHTAR
mmetsp:Transcript_44764/g.111434  ORF Transcript_44764/g.111434 Transcript_44764/m.111434 type:complete len:1135 (+) Transcript_44764:38-3442(+)